jgi:hypothetical protein
MDAVYSLNISLPHNLKTAGKKAGLKATMKNEHSLPKQTKYSLS